MSKREACGVPETAQWVEVDGVTLAVSREGRGAALVCLHAGGHGGGDYAPLAARIGDRFEVIRIDWPGQGRSGADRRPASAARYAELLAGVLARIDVHEPILLGNSIGGAAALIHASRYPVRGLVLCDTGGLIAVSPLTRAFCAAFTRFFAAGARGAGWFERAFAFYYRRIVLPSPAAAEQRARIIAAGAETAAVLEQAWRSFAQPDADLRALASRLTVPVWGAWARSDRVIPLWMCRPALHRIPNLRRITTYVGGHSAFLEQPDAFARDLLAFADSLRP